MKIYVTPHRIAAVTKAPGMNVNANWPLVVEALEWAGINAEYTQAAMAATIALETGNFRPIKEGRSNAPQSLVYQQQSKYYDKGYYGRGFIQITHSYNYEAAGKALKIDLLAKPDLALDPVVAARIAAWYFERNQIYIYSLGCNWEMVRRCVNGPAYAKNQPALQKFIGWCNMLINVEIQNV